MSDERYDGVLMTIVQQAQGIDGFFESVFGFLRRKTDFFTDQKRAEETIVKHSQAQFKLWDQTKKKEEEERLKREEKKKAQAAPVEKKEPVPEKKEEPKPKPTVVPQKTEAPVEDKKENEAAGEKGEEKKERPPGNGGKTDKYTWTQTLEELHLYIPIPAGVKARDMKIDLGTTKCYVGLNEQPAIIDGEWPERIKAEDSFWTIEDDDKLGKVVHLSIQKWSSQWHWLDCAIKGDPKIDTQKIEPEPSNLSDLDPETRATVDKMRFDQMQKQMGKPTSDELKKQEMLQQFMKAHPEMDFSKAKFS